MAKRMFIPATIIVGGIRTEWQEILLDGLLMATFRALADD